MPDSIGTRCCTLPQSAAPSPMQTLLRVQEPLLAPAPPAAPKDNVAKGMLWYGMSSFFFAAMGICSKLLGQYHYPVWEITLVRAVVIMSCCLSMLLHAGAPASRASHTRS
jgi:hypothetical protein